MKTCILFLFTCLCLHGIRVKAQKPHLDTLRTQVKAQQALAYCKQHGYNATYCILIDMSLPSGIKRFVVWDFKKSNIWMSGLVSHGCGTQPWSYDRSKEKPVFSNAANSHCTSLGKYRVDGRGYSMWGIHVKYYLTGLESTNSNAAARQVVFHSWDVIPDQEVYPIGTPEGWGCPAVSNTTMKAVDELLKKQKKHLLLWIYS
ncbi:murein L,D-transpeptidase catalytic domain-containing protein [Mucilaginibacter koreensis]